MNKFMNSVIDLAKRFTTHSGSGPSVADEIKALRAENERLRAELANANAIIKELQSRLTLNSRNSSKPPSSDGPTKPKPKSLRPRTGRKTGGQVGHEGKTLKMETPDLTIDYGKDVCECGRVLNDVSGTVDEVRQTHGIITAKLVTDHRRVVKVCPDCGAAVRGKFPEGVNARVQYDQSVERFADYGMNRQFTPFARTAEFLRDVFKIGLSEGTLGKFRTRLYARVKGPVSTIKSLIIAARVANFDETSFGCGGKRRWLHSASTDKLVYFHVTDGKGSEAMREVGVLPKFKGVAIHDHNKAYYKFENCAHGECDTHVIRELVFLHEERGQRWAAIMINLLLEAKGTVDSAKLVGERMLPDTMIDTIERAYDRVVGIGFAENPDVEPTGPPKRGRRKRSREVNLLIRLRQYKREHLLFIHDFDVPFDNNGAERSFRPEKTRQKISGTTRAEYSANEICAIRGYLATAARNGVNAYDAIGLALRGTPFVPAAG